MNTSTKDSPWNSSFPDAVGHYIAATTRRADIVRFWTGKHWTAPCVVRDMHLPDRMPRVDWPAAQTDQRRPIEWLERVVVDAEGFISWGGKLNETPVPPGAMATVRLRNGEQASGIISNDWRWKHDGGAGDIVAYRVVDCDSAPANAEPLERREQQAGRRASDTKESNPKDAAASGRVPMHLVPDTLVLYAAMAFAEGDSKYVGYNFRVAGVGAMTYVSALRRHLMRYVNGEWADKKTGVPHLGSIAACVGILIDGHVVGNIVDDRPPAIDLSDEIEEAERVIAHCYHMNHEVRSRSPVTEYTALSTGMALVPHTPHRASVDDNKAA